jgi:hypothetical protein
MHSLSVRLGLVLLLGATSTFGQTGPTQRQANNKAALDHIADFASRLCNSVQLTGKNTRLELSAEAKLELSRLLRKLAEAGVKMDAKFQSNDYQGLLQENLVAALKDSQECRLTVFRELKAELIEAPTSPAFSSRPGLPAGLKLDNSLSAVDPPTREVVRVAMDAARAAEAAQSRARAGESSFYSFHQGQQSFILRTDIGGQFEGKHQLADKTWMGDVHWGTLGVWRMIISEDTLRFGTPGLTVAEARLQFVGPLPSLRWGRLKTFVGMLEYLDKSFYFGEVENFFQAGLLPNGRGVKWTKDAEIIGAGIWEGGSMRKK